MKARPAKNKKKQLHQPPPEFAVAAREHDTEWWKAQDALGRANIERGRYVKMPAHRRPLTVEEGILKQWR